MPRRLAIVLSCCLATLILGLPAGSAKSRQTVTLKLTMITQAQQAMTVLIGNFERVYPNIQIQANYLPNDAFQTVLATQFQAGAAPDLFQVTAGGSVGIEPLGQAGKLLDLSKSPWVKRILPSVRPFMTVGGRVVAWPLALGPFGVIYNTDLFAQYRLTIPTTFSQVLTMCRQLAGTGKTLFAASFVGTSNSLVWAIHRADAYVFSVDPKWTAKRAANQTSFASSPLWRRALQSIVDMKEAGCFQPAPQATTIGQLPALVANGSALAMLGSGLQIPQILAVNPNFHYGLFALPPDVAKNTVVSVSASTNIAGNAATGYPDQVRAFINFLARPKQSSLYAKVGGGFASFDAIKANIPDFMKPVAALLKAGKTITNSSTPLSAVNPNLVLGVLAPDINGLFTGQKSVDDILNDLDKAWVAP